MIVRCGRCGTQFSAPGPGRYQCPGCGTANEIQGGGVPPSPPAPEPSPAPEPPSPRVTCPECGFGFIVGDVASAPCPNCRAEVDLGGEA